MYINIGRGNDKIISNDLQLSLKVIGHSTNRKLVYDLLLVAYSIVTFAVCTHRFRNKAVETWKSHFCLTHLYLTLNLKVMPWNMETKFGARKLELWGGLPYGEEIMIVGQTMWVQSTSVRDRQTDRHTYRFTMIKTAVASRARR